MQIIDEKGKLFGLINPIDLLVLVLVIAIAAGLYLKMRPTEKTQEYAVADVLVEAAFIHPETAKAVKVGDRLVANGSFTDARIIDLRVEPGLIATTKADGTRLLTTDPFNKDLYATIRGRVAPGEPDLRIAGQDVRVGKDDFYLKTQTVQLRAQVLKIDIHNND